MNKHSGVDTKDHSLYSLKKDLDRLAKSKDATPALRAALEKGYLWRENSGFFNDTRAADLANIKRVGGTGGNAYARATSFTGKVMRFAFQQSESSLRKITYATVFELEFKKAKAGGATDAAAATAADTAGMKAVLKTLFNYTSWDKPRIMTASPGLRLATQFMSFAMQMSSLMIRTFHSKGGLSALKTKEERKYAAQQFYGMMGMTGLLGGITGLPMYGMVMVLLDKYAELFGEDDEGEPDFSNPLYHKNSDLWFRKYAIPSYFGPNTFLSRFAEVGVSAFGPDISASTSLADLPFFFIPDVKGWLSPEEAVRTAMYDTALGPTGGVITGYTKAAREFREGNTLRGMEALLPNFIKGPVTSYRYATEGVKDRSGAVIRTPEEIDFMQLVFQSLGFRPEDIANKQRTIFLTGEASRNIVEEKTRIYTQIDKAKQRGDTKRVRELILEKVIPFNRRNPTVGFILDDIRASLEGRTSSRRRRELDFRSGVRGLARWEREIAQGGG